MDDLCNFTNNSFNDNFLDDNCSFQLNSSGFGVQPGKKLERAFKLLFYSVACVGNFLLLFVMHKDPLKRFRNATSYFIINLTLADLLSTVSGITESAIQLNPQDPQKLFDTLESQNIAACIDGIGIQCALLMTMIFSIDRYIAIVHAYTYKNVVANKYIVVTAIILPWCFAIIALPVMYFALLNKDIQEALTRMLAGNFTALTCITLTVHPYTHSVFLRRLKDLRKSSTTHQQLMEQNLRVAKVLATTVLLVSICLAVFISPYFVAFCFNIAKCDTCFLHGVFLSFWQYYPLLSCVRIMMNSVVYAWRLPLYRKSLKVILDRYINGYCGMLRNRVNSSHLTGHRMNPSEGTLDADQSIPSNDKCVSAQSNYCHTSECMEQPIPLTNSRCK